MSSKKEFLSTTMKRTTEWIFSQEIPSDITVRVGSSSFSLHKFPLVSKCGYIRKLVSGSTKANPLDAQIADVPGGAEAFELVVNFCYGVNFEISIDNIAMLRCVAEYLEMTEECAVGNLIGRAEAYLSQVALQNLSGSISVLHSSEKLLPLAEDVKLVSRCIDAIAYLACNDTQSCVMSRAEAPTVDWWAEDLAILKIDFFQRVLVAMMALDFKQYSLGPILMLYAQKSLRGLDVFGKVKKRIEPREEHEKRSVLETIVSLLPKEKNALSVSFLAMLLRFSKYLETTVACRVDLEKRIALQLGQAVLDDLLIPSYSLSGGTSFDVDTVRRIVLNYLEYVVKGNRMGIGSEEEYVSPLPSDLEGVGRIMENYLAEIASDRGLTVAKFMGIAQLIPEQTRAIEDGMYRAIDVFLKAHPEASEMERKQVCSLMDCQKLSREACAHAAQNDRIPVQTVVQVLYYEQQRMRSALNSSNGASESNPVPTTSKEKALSVYSNSDQKRNELEGLRRENEDLRIELVKTKMRLKEFERCASSPVAVRVSSPTSSANNFHLSAADHNKPRLPRKSFITSVSKKLGRLYPLIKVNAVNPPPIVKARSKPGRDRRHSIS
ncbi:hypothetical protein V2J09_016256 [Rumex salicifolius]